MRKYTRYLDQVYAEKTKENNKLPKGLIWSVRLGEEITSNALSESDAKKVADAISEAFPKGANQIEIIQSRFSPGKFQVIIPASIIEKDIVKKVPELPPEIINHILSFLKRKDIAKVASVSKIWQGLSKSLLEKLTDTEINQAMNFMNNRMKETWEVLQEHSEEIKEHDYSKFNVVGINRIENDEKNVNVIVENLYMTAPDGQKQFIIQLPVTEIKAFAELDSEMSQSKLKR